MLETLKSRAMRAGTICRDKRMSQSEIASALGASQAQVSRILAGRAQKQSRLFEEVCLYLEKLDGGVTTEAVRANEELLEAVASIWDGSAQNARAISVVIRSLAALTGVSAESQIIKGGEHV